MGVFNSLFKSIGNNNVINNRNFHSEGVELTRFSDYNEEFGPELSANTDSDNLSDSYSESGVHLKEATTTLKLVYEGILAKSGAQEIYTVIGYGDNRAWDNVEEYSMNKTEGQAFELIFPVKKTADINLVFKDSMGNWDNNSGMNYTFLEGSNRDS